MTPIWQDYYVDLGDAGYASPYEYLVTVDGQTVFMGRAYARPDGEMKVKVNDIVAGYLFNSFPALTFGDHPSSGLIKTVEVVSAEDQEVIDSEEFFLDYSYDYENTEQGEFLSAPITGEFVSGMILMFTHSGSITFKRDGVASLTPDTVGNYLMNGNASVVSIGSVDLYHKVESLCGINYALYYQNVYGGWDFLLMRGRCTEKQVYTRQRVKVEFDNNTNQKGEREYQNEIRTEYELRTGFLTEAQASQMFQLVGSSNVYLWRSDTGLFSPVVVEDKEWTAKTYADGPVIQYTINVVDTQTRERR